MGRQPAQHGHRWKVTNRVTHSTTLPSGAGAVNARKHETPIGKTSRGSTRWNNPCCSTATACSSDACHRPRLFLFPVTRLCRQPEGLQPSPTILQPKMSRAVGSRGRLGSTSSGRWPGRLPFGAGRREPNRPHGCPPSGKSHAPAPNRRPHHARAPAGADSGDRRRQGVSNLRCSSNLSRNKDSREMYASGACKCADCEGVA